MFVCKSTNALTHCTQAFCRPVHAACIHGTDIFAFGTDEGKKEQTNGKKKRRNEDRAGESHNERKIKKEKENKGWKEWNK